MTKIRVLAVDDEDLNLDIIGEFLNPDEYAVSYAKNGLEAFNMLESAKSFDVVLLDRMMPIMNGMEFVQKVREKEVYNELPIIMQTAASAQTQVSEGLRAGVFYYLSKPYTKEVLIAVIKAAHDDKKSKDELKRMIREYGYAMSMLDAGRFTFKTVEEAKSLAALIGSGMSDPGLNIIGLTEIMLNAIEHGNYGITYNQKRDWKLADIWDQEFSRVASRIEHKDKYAIVLVQKVKDEFVVRVRDMGMGFNYKSYLEFSPERLTDPNGRGILMIMNSGFNKVEYIGDGNEVEVRVGLNRCHN